MLITGKKSSPTSAGPARPSGGGGGGAAAEMPRNNGGPLDMSSLFAGGMPKLRSTGRNIGRLSAIKPCANSNH